MPDDRKPLTKTEFRRGLGCARRAWLDRWRPDLRPPISPALRERFDTGRQIGELAWQRYPDGKFAAKSDAFQLIGEGARCLFEPTFQAQGLKARLDILWKSGADAWTIDEVKMASAKPIAVLERSDYVVDLAFQVATAQKVGVEIEAARLVLVDTSYTWTPPAPVPPKPRAKGGQLTLFDLSPESAAGTSKSAYDPNSVLTAVDLTIAVAKRIPQIHSESGALLEVLSRPEEPVVEINTHCKNCDYAEYCLANEPKHSVIFLPRIKPKDVRSMRLAGYQSIPEIDDEYGLGEKHLRVRDVIRSGRPFISPALASRLAEISYPAAFIDYETCSTALPIYPGTRPYQQIAFQWSAHIIDVPGTMPHHLEFLVSHDRDPREEFCSALWNALQGCRSILHYSGFEISQMKAMAEEGIPLAAELLELIAERTIDLEQIVDQHVYFEGFNGRTSIKYVLPVLVPELSYADLEIADGQAASTAFRALLAGDTTRRAALLEYCKRDTLAMVEIFKALTNLA